NGSGKTTLMRGLVGLNLYLEGEVDWYQDGPAAYLYMGHRAGISAHLTVLENLVFLAQIRGLQPSPKALQYALEAVALAPFDDSLGHQLSAGQQRRIMLALLHLPGLPGCWVLDEPFTALDKQGAAALEAHLARHCARGGAVIFSTHQEPLALNFWTLELGVAAA
ncbi:MAG: heme ABC exporter ATP-binding protein CcmA, partial [Natronospirillum sp.]